MALTYSNPRLEATFTIDPRTGRPSAPKRTTYAVAARIVDGSDGKTYAAHLSIYRMVSIMQSNLQFQQETVHEDDARYPALLALFVEENR